MNGRHYFESTLPHSLSHNFLAHLVPLGTKSELMLSPCVGRSVCPQLLGLKDSSDLPAIWYIVTYADYLELFLTVFRSEHLGRRNGPKTSFLGIFLVLRAKSISS